MNITTNVAPIPNQSDSSTPSAARPPSASQGADFRSFLEAAHDPGAAAKGHPAGRRPATTPDPRDAASKRGAAPKRNPQDPANEFLPQAPAAIVVDDSDDEGFGQDAMEAETPAAVDSGANALASSTPNETVNASALPQLAVSATASPFIAPEATLGSAIDATARTASGLGTSPTPGESRSEPRADRSAALPSPSTLAGLAGASRVAASPAAIGANPSPSPSAAKSPNPPLASASAQRTSSGDSASRTASPTSSSDPTADAPPSATAAARDTSRSGAKAGAAAAASPASPDGAAPGASAVLATDAALGAMPSDKILTTTANGVPADATSSAHPSEDDVATDAQSAMNKVVILNAAHGALDHPELGHIDVRAHSKDGEVDVRVTSQRAETASFLAPRVEAMSAAANVPAARIEIGTRGGPSTGSFDASGNGGGQKSDDRAPTESDDDTSAAILPTAPGRVRIVL
jgi:hypothetical protein